jgi:ribose/xylose/arabinose/galactoside ABC-type transport system permease subunit
LTLHTTAMSGGQSRMWLRQSYGLLQALAVLIVLVVVISLITPRFLSWINIYNLMGQMSVNLIVAAGMTCIMISGEFDISVGSVVALTAAVSASLMSALGIVPAVLLSLLVGPLLGVLNGVIVTKGRIPSFIATLAMLMMARSLAFVITQGRVVTVPDEFKWLGQENLLLVPNPFVVALLFYVVGWFILTRTTFGKSVYAVGANANVALLSGIRPAYIKIWCFAIVGFTASCAGNLLLSRIGAIQADTARGLEFEVIAAVVIGGTSLYGGQGNILRTIVGVIIIAIIRNFLNLSRMDIFWQDFATGAIIIVAVLFDALQKRLDRQRQLKE